MGGIKTMSCSITVAVLMAFLFKSGECTISAWSKPVIATADGGNGALAETIDDGITTGTATGITITATTEDTISAYTLVAQDPTDVAFAIDSSGVVTVTTGTVTYTTTAIYTLVISATDSAGTATATVTLSVNDKPVFGASSYGLCIADEAAVGTTLATLVATDVVNSGSLTYSIANGNTDTDFSISNAGVIKTLNVIDASTVAGYSLVLNAADDSLTGTATVWVIVADCGGSGSGAAALLAGTMTLIMAMTTMVLC